MFRRVQDERAPAATDIEQALTGTQAQFAADVIKLAFLCRIEVIVWRLEISGGINHVPIKPQSIKIVRNVVVKRYCALIALDRVSFAADSWQQMPRGTSHRRSTVRPGKRNQQPSELQLSFPITNVRQQKVSDVKSSLDVAFDIEVVVQICFGTANFCPRQKHSAERFGMF